MHVIGKIKRGCATRQIDDFALGREGVDAVREELDAGALKKIPLRILPCNRLQQPPHPLDLARVLLVACATLFVLPVRGDAKLGLLVHLARADLNFNAQLLRSNHGGVDRAVQIFLGQRDVVIELSWHIAPIAVHDP